MKIVRAFPPNYTKIIEAFPYVKGKTGVLFAWKDRLYNPSGAILTPWLIAHENIHCERQVDPEAWWMLYLGMPSFRAIEEILAHQKEWEVYKMTAHNSEKADIYLGHMVARLSGPLYGNLMTPEDARHAITGEHFDPPATTPA